MMMTSKKSKLASLICLLVTSMAIALSMFYFGYVRFNYVDISEFPVQGLDVSHHQGAIDWKKAKNSRFKFVFIKATEGGDFVDPKLNYNRGNASKNGFLVGAYHFFTFRKPGAEQARNFIAAVPNDKKSLPPVIDLEFMGNSETRLSREELRKELSDFIGIVEARYNKKPILYTTYEFYEFYLEGYSDRYLIWIRDIFKKPDFINWTFWQYANRARIEGIEQYVDLNVFNGSEDEFNNLFHGNDN
jgi:lysozyme